jgi:hypothetical protein
MSPPTGLIRFTRGSCYNHVAPTALSIGAKHVLSTGSADSIRKRAVCRHREARDLVVSLTTIQPATIDWTINLRRWTMKPPILRVEFATAKISAIF